jgi:hypothetical protein
MAEGMEGIQLPQPNREAVQVTPTSFLSGIGSAQMTSLSRTALISDNKTNKMLVIGMTIDWWFTPLPTLPHAGLLLSLPFH